MSAAPPTTYASKAQVEHAISIQASSAPLGAIARKRALRQTAIGLALVVAGVVVTAVTYGGAASSPSGGTYAVAWGPVLFGIIATVRGFSALRHSRKL
jgi:hypothetical protein